MPLFLSESDVAALLEPADAVRAVEECFRRIARGEVVNAPRRRLRLAEGSLAVDTRLRDALRSLGFGEGKATGTPIAFETPGAVEAATYAGEFSALQESDLGLAFGTRVDALERRLSALERRPWSRVRAKVGAWRA